LIVSKLLFDPFMLVYEFQQFLSRLV
jgi:hypothetical protein